MILLNLIFQRRRHMDKEGRFIDPELDLGDFAARDMDPRSRLDMMHNMRHHRPEDREYDMKSRHSDMMSRRTASYKDRVAKVGLNSDEEMKVLKMIDDFMSVETKLMDYRLESKSERLKPEGDMRDEAVKAKFKADLRKHIDSRREVEHAMRDEAKRLRETIDQILEKSAKSEH